MKQYRPRLSKQQYDLVCGTDRRVLVIGDLHEPFSRRGYLKFCKDMYAKYGCNEVVFIGDIMDNHFSSFHDTDPDGHSAAEELKRAKERIAVWYREFPKAKVCLGNHDLIPDRKAFNAGLSKSWIRSIGEVLDTPNWKFSEEFTIDGVKYVHGTGLKAKSRTKNDMISVVQGHYHSEGHITFYVGDTYKIFSMQIGCGVDRTAYSMAYGKNFPKMHLNCGVVLNDGTLPILEYMSL